MSRARQSSGRFNVMSLLRKAMQKGGMVLGERQRQIKGTWKFKTVHGTVRYRNREHRYALAVVRAENRPTRKNRRRVVIAERKRKAAAGCRIPMSKTGWNI